MVKVGYEHSIKEFLRDNESNILGEIAKNFPLDINLDQKQSWSSQISILQTQLSPFNGYILFEYKIPRMESIIDNVLLIDGIIFVVEFKVGKEKCTQENIDQLIRYIQQLKNFHYESEDKILVPILICTESNYDDEIFEYKKNEIKPFKTNGNNLSSIIKKVCDEHGNSTDLSNWSKSKYVPSPSILEAARELYETHEVQDISTYSANKSIFDKTEDTIDEIIKNSKENKRKSIIFVTGVPGAGKTLVGLNIATKRSVKDDDHAVFLSGNGPLVNVLRESLARDSYKRNKHSTTKIEAKTKVSSFIQPIHQFREDAMYDNRKTHEKIVIFDEAQRAWTKEKTESFMEKRNMDLSMSEPEFLISIMDRQDDWAVIICLVGQGQEINTGEAGITEWYKALDKSYPNWDIYANENTEKINEQFNNLKIHNKEELYLSITQRSVEAPTIPQFIEFLLNNDPINALKSLVGFKEEYPLYITRNLKKAKKWVKYVTSNCEDDSIRCGLLAQSSSRRLMPEGIDVKNDMSVENWFLNDADDFRSSNHLEFTATEFDVQGLEIDYSIVAWDANLRYINEKFEYYSFRSPNWVNIKDENISGRTYLINSYRVLLTRARRGMVIFVPEGDNNDKTRLKEYYDGTYEYLKKIGIREL